MRFTIANTNAVDQHREDRWTSIPAAPASRVEDHVAKPIVV